MCDMKGENERIMKRSLAMSWESTQGGKFIFFNYLIIGCALNDNMPW